MRRDSFQRLRNECESCKCLDATLRRCTGQWLCSMCRDLPSYKIVALSSVSRASNLPAKELLFLRAGKVPNPVNKRFASVSICFWKDAVEFCMKAGIDYD